MRLRGTGHFDPKHHFVRLDVKSMILGGRRESVSRFSRPPAAVNRFRQDVRGSFPVVSETRPFPEELERCRHVPNRSNRHRRVLARIADKHGMTERDERPHAGSLTSRFNFLKGPIPAGGRGNQQGRQQPLTSWSVDARATPRGSAAKGPPQRVRLRILNLGLFLAHRSHSGGTPSVYRLLHIEPDWNSNRHGQ